MASDEFDDVKLDGEFNESHLLALIMEMSIVSEMEACLKLQVPKEKVHEWRLALQNEGLVEMKDEETGEGIMKLTREGMRRVKELQKEWKAQGAPGEVARTASLKGKPKIKPLARLSSAQKTGLMMDFLIVGLTVLSLRMLKLFMEDPNMQILSFFFGSLLLSIVLLLYQQYKKTLKTRGVVTFVVWILQTLKAYRQMILFFLVIVLMIYSVGMLFMDSQNMGVYIILSVVLASTGHLIYTPHRTWFSIVKYYVGVILLVSGLVMVMDWLSLTEIIFGGKTRLLDFLFGVGFLVIAYLNENDLGLAVAPKPKPQENQLRK